MTQTCAATVLRAERVGRIAYEPMLARQEACHQQRIAGEGEDTLFLLEHAPVITLGKNAREGHLLCSRDWLRARGIEVYRASRGGDVTYHGPGQIVGYPILKLGEGEQDIKRYVWRLEEILIRTLADFGVSGHRVPGLRGIWVGDDKIGAVGVRIAQWVTLHGFSLNVSVDFSHYDFIVPCGLHGCGVTSLAKLLDAPPTMHEVETHVLAHAADVLEREVVSP